MSGNYSLKKLYSGQLDLIEKKNRLSTSGVTHQQRLPTGVLVADLIMNGGLLPGMYSIAGPEQSAKSTLCFHTLDSALINDVPIVYYWDAEGSVDPEYTGKIVKSGNLQDIFKSKRARYMSEMVLETFYDTVADILRHMPRKVYFDEAKAWGYLIPKRDKRFGNFIEKAGLKVEKKLTDDLNFVCLTERSQVEAVVIIDSYPSLVPEDVDEEDKKLGMGLNARKFSENINRIAGKLRRHGMVVFGVNQLREKPAVQYGCYHASTKVMLADGTKKTIKYIVDNKIEGPVMAFNSKTNKFEPKKIVNWFNNGSTNDWLKIKYKSISRGAIKNSVIVTPNHFLWHADKSKLVRAKDFKVGDKLLTISNNISLNEFEKQVVMGVSLGDGHFKVDKDKLLIKISHKIDHIWYNNWLKKILSVRSHYKNNKNIDVLELNPIMESKIIEEAKARKFGIPKRSHKKNLTDYLAKNIDLLGLAIWWMDDASKSKNIIKMTSYSLKDVKKFIKIINHRLKFNFKLTEWKGKTPGYGIIINDRDMEKIAPYVCKEFKKEVKNGVKNNCLASGYTSIKSINKKVPKWVNLFGTKNLVMDKGLKHGVAVEIVSIEKFDAKQPVQTNLGENIRIKSDERFDIEVEDHGLFVVNEIVGKNSPYYEPGGNALKFYSMVRNQIFARAVPQGWDRDSDSGQCIEDAIDGGKDYYQFKHMKNTKNKYGTPFMSGWTRVWTKDSKGVGRGFDPVFDTYTYLSMTGQISGPKKKLVLKLKEFKNRTVDWKDLKKIVLQPKRSANELALPKNFSLRKFCEDQISSGNIPSIVKSQED
jgi:RecA/RadA recombinase